MAGLKPEWRRVLEHRSVADKIGVPIDCDIARPGDFNIIAELVREGIIEWIDRTVLRTVMVKENGKLSVSGGRIRRPNIDVYRLTPKGVALCDAEGIKGH